MLDGRKGDAGIAGGALEKVAAVLAVTHQVFRGEQGAVAGRTEDGRHGKILHVLVVYTVYREAALLSPGYAAGAGRCGMPGGFRRERGARDFWVENSKTHIKQIVTWLTSQP